MTSLLMPPEQQWIDANGNPLAGGQIFTYIEGTLTPKSTYQDKAKTIPNANPVVLDSAGRAIIYGDGIFRFIVKDFNSNTVYDQVTEAYLGDTEISTVMQPVTSANTLQTARDRMGVTQAIQTALNTVGLLPGPVGPTGPAGATGGVGPTGSSASSYQPTVAASSQSYARFPNANGTAASVLMQAGTGTVSGGNGSVTFPVAFPQQCFCVIANPNDSATGSFWISTFSISTTGFQVKGSSPLVSPWSNASTGFNWIAFGW